MKCLTIVGRLSFRWRKEFRSCKISSKYGVRKKLFMQSLTSSRVGSSVWIFLSTNHPIPFLNIFTRTVLTRGEMNDCMKMSNQDVNQVLTNIMLRLGRFREILATSYSEYLQESLHFEYKTLPFLCFSKKFDLHNNITLSNVCFHKFYSTFFVRGNEFYERSSQIYNVFYLKKRTGKKNNKK